MTQTTLLLPPISKFGGIALPSTLGKVLGRAKRSQYSAGEEAQLLRHFHLLPNRLAQAALSRVPDVGLEDAQQGIWLRADPAHIRPDINGARLLGIGRTVGIGQADVDALLPALRPLFGDLGMALDVPHPERWYVRLAAGVSLPAFASPEAALGDDVFEHIPEGAEARRWRVLLNEVQIVLHNHPHNEVRLANGRVPINALWFWGGGALPDAVQCEVDAVFSDEPALCGLAELAKRPCQAVSAYTASQQRVLVDLRQQRDWRGLLEQWMLPACQQEAVFDFTDGAVFTVTPKQRWRFWRKPLQTLRT